MIIHYALVSALWGRLPNLRPIDNRPFAAVGNRRAACQAAPQAVNPAKIPRMVKHTAGYTAEQLADVIAYIRWVSYGDTKGVSPDDIE